MSLFRRNQMGERERLFDDLSPQQRQSAWSWLNEFLSRQPLCPRWLYPILIGQARRLAINPPTSAWGRSMQAKKGGYAVQRKYRAEGRSGPNHPAHKAAGVSADQRRWRKQEREDARRRERLGLPAKPRVYHIPLSI
jgi:hypothetical protein